MASWVSHIVWGALMSLVPIIAIGFRYIKEPGLTDSLIPFEYIIHLPFLFAGVNLLLQVVVAPVINRSSYTAYTDVILGVLAGLIYGAYARYVGGLNLPHNLWTMKNPDNIYLSMIFYCVIAYALVVPYLQRQVCFHGPRGC
jgi:hypothetical protein